MRASQVIQRLLELMEVAGCDPDVTLHNDRFDEETLESACFELRWVDPIPEERNEDPQPRSIIFNMPHITPGGKHPQMAIPVRQDTERNEDTADRVRHYRHGTQIQVISVF